jgi:thiol-disulfide isomerase/thioredoxin
MRRPRSPIVAFTVPALLAGLLLSGCGGSSSDAGTVADRPAAAPFTLTLFDGTTFDLADHLATDGRPVFLNFWASWCPPCREEMPEFDAAARTRSDVVFVGVAVDDDPAAARAFAVEELGISYPVGADADGSISGAYAYRGLPTSWLIGSDGTIITTYAGRVSPDLLDHILDQAGT